MNREKDDTARTTTGTMREAASADPQSDVVLDTTPTTARACSLVSNGAVLTGFRLQGSLRRPRSVFVANFTPDGPPFDMGDWNKDGIPDRCIFGAGVDPLKRSDAVSQLRLNDMEAAWSHSDPAVFNITVDTTIFADRSGSSGLLVTESGASGKTVEFDPLTPTAPYGCATPGPGSHRGLSGAEQAMSGSIPAARSNPGMGPWNIRNGSRRSGSSFCLR